jgi:hypothetical protein
MSAFGTEPDTLPRHEFVTITGEGTLEAQNAQSPISSSRPGER